MIALLVTLLLGQEKLPDKATLEGVVVNSLTGEKISKANLSLDDGKISYAVRSRVDGRFSFDGIEPELYQLSAERQGFLDEVREDWIEVSNGDHVKGMVIQLTPQSAIAGCVVDDDGDPVPNARVGAKRTARANGRVIVFDQRDETSNGEGCFFVGGLKHGRYYLSVIPPQLDPSKPGHPGQEEYFVPTDDPLPIDVPVGTTVRNIEIHIHRGPVFRIRGRISNWTRGRGPVELVPVGAHAEVEDDAFEFTNVAPGSYSLAVQGSFCPVPVSVDERSVDGLSLEFSQTPSVTGVVSLEDGGQFADPPVVSMRPLEHRGAMAIAAKGDGTFVWIPRPGRYVIDYTPPENYYVKSIQFNHQTLVDNFLDLTGCVDGTLEIIDAPGAATITVRIQDRKDVKVTLWGVTGVRTQKAQGESAVFGNLAPGEYRILAWEQVDDDYLEIPEFLAHFNPQKITVSEGSHESVEIKLISKQASDAAASKLQ